MMAGIPEEQDIDVPIALLPVLDQLKGFQEILERAKRIRDSLPRDVAEIIESRDRDPRNAFVSLEMTRMHPETFQQLTDHISRLVRTVEEVIEHQNKAAQVGFSHRDLSLLRGSYQTLEMLGSRSKREVARFHDARNAGDAGTLILTIQMSSPRKLEARFVHQLPAVLREQLGL